MFTVQLSFKNQVLPTNLNKIGCNSCDIVMYSVPRQDLLTSSKAFRSVMYMEWYIYVKILSLCNNY